MGGYDTSLFRCLFGAPTFVTKMIWEDAEDKFLLSNRKAHGCTSIPSLPFFCCTSSDVAPHVNTFCNAFPSSHLFSIPFCNDPIMSQPPGVLAPANVVTMPAMAPSIQVHKVRNEATKGSSKLSKGQVLEDAVRSAQQVGNAAATRAFLQAKLIMGPTVSSGLEFVETPYVGGTLVRKLLKVLKHCWGHILEKLLKKKLGGWVFSLEASSVVGLVGRSNVVLLGSRIPDSAELNKVIV
ncbi:hypothetical protein CQW23_02215 [Capsicum baccatum]|uniref:Uncharacterized protein n=1 Tax=Capsicum baccatum TaxID=33114 RepID=A0A2G2XQU4_CAPBA|nr:hypothetical protein CQW23_02215 [Capsicum baccatum]